LTEELASALKQNMNEIAIAPFGDGRFEVFVDGKKIYSKLETGDFPDNATLTAKIKKMR
jgi:selenoprotein W-related protein